LSLNRVVEALVSLGLSPAEARIYVFLEKSGSHEDIEIKFALKLRTKKLISSLRNLQDKKIVKASTQQTAKFSAVPFEKAIDLLIEVKKEQAKTLQASKKELLSAWRSITEKEYAKS
jgi:sugar-specific transcriptional regulator TrmB